MDFAKAVFDVEFSTARQQPGAVVVVNVHLRPIRDMHREGAERFCAEAVANFVDPHERDASRWELAAQGRCAGDVIQCGALREARDVSRRDDGN